MHGHQSSQFSIDLATAWLCSVNDIIARDPDNERCYPSKPSSPDSESHSMVALMVDVSRPLETAPELTAEAAVSCLPRG